MNFLDGISESRNQQKPKSSNGLGVIAMLTLLVGIVGFMIISSNKSDDPNKNEQRASHQLFKFDPRVASEKDTKNDTTTIEQEPVSEEEVPQPNDQPAAEEPTVTTPNANKNFTIRIANGSDTNGLAGKYADTLKGNGFNVITVNNALAKRSQTTLFYLTGKKAEADLIAAEMGSPKVVLEEFESGDISDSADVVIVLGSDRDE